MKLGALIAAILWCSMVAGHGQALSPEQVAQVNYEQHLGQRVPLNAEFRDESGAPVRLGNYFGQRPVMLALAYYDCPSLCTIVLNGMLESARNLRLEAGRDFEIVVVSIRPGDSSKAAAAKKHTYTMRYGRPGSARGWHFLTGDAAPIQELSNAVGFHSVYDPKSNQFAHPSGIVVLTPDGQVSQYFLGIEYPPLAVNDALLKAGRHQVGSLSERLLLLCFHYDPKTGHYSLAITRLLQAAGLGTVVLLAAVIVYMSRRKPVVPRPGWGIFAAFPLLPERASNLAQSVDAIFYALLAVCGLITLGLFTAAIFFCIRYRKGSSAPRPATQPRSLAFEIAWTSITLLAFAGIFVWAAVVYFRMARPPGNAMEIRVVAKQWMWKAQHPDGRREINELHLVLNQPVKLIMTSQDVIHDFFVPAFRTKQDVLPSRYTVEWFTPILPGKYHLFCAEYCGTDHSQMGGWIYVMEPNEYARWQAGQPSAESIVTTGARLFQARGCSGCHAPNSTIRAPLLDHIYGKPVALSDGTVVVADDQYLHDSILLPNKQITAGYEAKMPTFQGQLSEEEVMQLIAYIKSLGDLPGGQP